MATTPSLADTIRDIFYSVSYIHYKIVSILYILQQFHLPVVVRNGHHPVVSRHYTRHILQQFHLAVVVRNGHHPVVSRHGQLVHAAIEADGCGGGAYVAHVPHLKVGIYITL